MKTRYLHIVLTLIALGLWANAFATWSHAQTSAATQGATEFLDYRQLIDNQRAGGARSEDIELLLLAHIAGNTRAALR